MKIFLTILFVTFYLIGFTQTKHNDKIKISVAKIDKAIKLDEILDIEIYNCHVVSYHFTANLGVTVKSFNISGEDISSAMKAIIKELSAGDKFVVENVKYDCVSAPPFKTTFIYLLK